MSPSRTCPLFDGSNSNQPTTKTQYSTFNYFPFITKILIWQNIINFSNTSKAYTIFDNNLKCICNWLPLNITEHRVLTNKLRSKYAIQKRDMSHQLDPYPSWSSHMATTLILPMGSLFYCHVNLMRLTDDGLRKIDAISATDWTSSRSLGRCKGQELSTV